MRARLQVRVHVNTCVSMYVIVHAGTRVWEYACMCPCLHICMYVCIYACVPESSAFCGQSTLTSRLAMCEQMLEVLGSKEIKAWSKEQYSLLKEFYQRTPEWKSNNNKKVHLADIKIFAGIHNQNRAMFEKGLRDWKTHTMACFDELENDETEDPTLSDAKNELPQFTPSQSGTSGSTAAAVLHFSQLCFQSSACITLRTLRRYAGRLGQAQRSSDEGDHPRSPVQHREKGLCV